MRNDQPASQAYVRELEERIADLESRLESLTEQHIELSERLLRLSLATVPEPRFPFWTWYIRSHMPEQTRNKLQQLLLLLSFRAEGETIPDPFRKDIEGVPHELLNSPEPLTAEEISIAVKAVTGIHNEARVAEMFEALKGQSIQADLCDLYLASYTEIELSHEDNGKDLDPEP